MKKVGLGHLVERLDEEGPWDQTLSGGEKQRLAFARIFLHRPDIIVLDEATAALDSPSQDQLMELLCREFEEATIVSFGHRLELEAFHDRKIILKRGRGGAKLVSDYLIPKPVVPSETVVDGRFCPLEFQVRAAHKQNARVSVAASCEVDLVALHWVAAWPVAARPTWSTAASPLIATGLAIGR